jgi:hypothetical protein
MIGKQLVELAPHVHHATPLCHVQLEAGLVAAEVVGDELALPAGAPVQAKERARMLVAASLRPSAKASTTGVIVLKPVLQ